MLVAKGEAIPDELARVIANDKKIEKIKVQDRPQNLVKVRAYIGTNTRYYDADNERHFIVAEASVGLDSLGQFVTSRVAARRDHATPDAGNLLGEPRPLALHSLHEW